MFPSTRTGPVLPAFVSLVFSAGLALTCSAQPLEQVLVETYHVQRSENGGAPVTTYRIFLDLAPDHTVQVLYGDDHHSLRIETFPEFHNTTEGSIPYGDRAVVDTSHRKVLATDSWLTIGLVGKDHVGIPRNMDPDGSLLSCPPLSASLSPDKERPVVDPLCVSDGLVPFGGGKEVVNFLMETTYLENFHGPVIETTNGAWAVLGGMKGATEENLVLVAQIATADLLHFILNVQLGTPDGGFVKIVAKDPQEGELQFDQLIYGVRYGH